MEAASLSDVRATIAPVLEVERGTLTTLEQSQISALRAVHGPITMLELDIPPSTPTLPRSDGLYPTQNGGVDGSSRWPGTAGSTRADNAPGSTGPQRSTGC